MVAPGDRGMFPQVAVLVASSSSSCSWAVSKAVANAAGDDGQTAVV